MIIKDILGVFSTFFKRYNDDPVDRLHYLNTVIALSVYCLFITSKLYYGEPLQCSIGGDTITADMAKYAHSMCWVNGTFIVQQPVNGRDVLAQRRINYYQWMVFVLVLQCFLFSLPSYFWNYLLYLNGFDMVYVNKNIMQQIYLDEYVESLNWSKTQRKIESISDHIRMTFLKQKNAITDKFNIKVKDESKPNTKEKADIRKQFPNLKTKRTFPLFMPYVLVKLAYMLVIVANFEFLSWRFGFNYYTYGIELSSTRFGHDQKDDYYFPFRAMCEVEYFSKKYQNTIAYMCTLPVNLFHRVFYLIFWYWLLALGLVTLFSVFYWLRLLIKPLRKRLVYNALQLDENKSLNSSYTAAYYLSDDINLELADSFLVEKTGLKLKQNFDLFFEHVCSLDVIFAIKLISLNSSSLAFRDILNNLWDHYLNLEELKIRDVKQRPMNVIKRPRGFKEVDLNEKSQA